MALLTLTDESHRTLQRFRRNTWKAIFLCAALRLADAALGLGLVAANPSFAAQETPSCACHPETSQ
jgi:hypothetical protein